MWFVIACVFEFVCGCLLMLNAFVCFVRAVSCDVIWFVVLCVVSVLALLVLIVCVRFACDI